MYAFQQQVETSANASTTTIAAPSITPAAGNLLVIAVCYESATTTPVSLSDTAGNTFISIGEPINNTGDPGELQFFYAPNCVGGATVITATFGATKPHRGIYVAEYSGIVPVLPLGANAGQAQNSPGTGADAVTSGNANCQFVPALAWGFVWTSNVSSTAFSAIGAAFTPGTPVWAGLGTVANGLPMDQRLTASGNIAATATNIAGTDSCYSGVACFAESLPVGWTV